MGSSARSRIGAPTSCSRDGHPLLLPAGELGGNVALSPAQPHCRQQLARPGPLVVGGLERHDRRRDVVERRESGEQVKALEDETDPPPERRPPVTAHLTENERARRACTATPLPLQ